MNLTVTGLGKPSDLNKTTYEEYCRLYLIERINDVIPSLTSKITYNGIYRLINIIHSDLFTDLDNETTKIILLNKIYSLFMAQYNEILSREYLMDHLNHLSKICEEFKKGK